MTPYIYIHISPDAAQLWQVNLYDETMSKVLQCPAKDPRQGFAMTRTALLSQSVSRWVLAGVDSICRNKKQELLAQDYAPIYDGGTNSGDMLAEMRKLNSRMEWRTRMMQVCPLAFFPIPAQKPNPTKCFVDLLTTCGELKRHFY